MHTNRKDGMQGIIVPVSDYGIRKIKKKERGEEKKYLENRIDKLKIDLLHGYTFGGHVGMIQGLFKLILNVFV